MNQAEKDKIVSTLQEKFAKNPCPRCGNPEFALVDGYANQPIQDEIVGIVLGGKTIPTIIAVCTRCGFLSQHALGVLGLIPKSLDENGSGDYGQSK